MLCATSSFCDARRPSSTLSSVVALSRSEVLASLSSTSLFTRPRSRLSCSMATSIWAICALAEATVPRYCVTCVSYSRLSICPSTWPRTTCSPSFTLSESRSPVTLLLTFTVSRAWRCPAAVTTRVTVPFFATEVVTSAGGGAFVRRPCTVAKPTTATTIPARIQRPFVISLSTLCAAQGRLGLAAVHQRSNHVELGLRELQLGVAHFQLRTHTHLLPGAREPQAFLRRLFRLLRDAGLLPRGGQLRNCLLYVRSDVAPAVRKVVLCKQHLDLRFPDIGVGAEAVEHVPTQVDRPRQAGVAVHMVGEAAVRGREAVIPRPQRQGRPVIALGDGNELPVLFGPELERLQAGPVLQRVRDRFGGGRRLGRLLHETRRFRDSQRLAGIDADCDCEIRPGQLHHPLLAKAQHLVVVAVGASGVDVRLGRAP